VLVIDDDADIRASLTELLERAGLSVEQPEEGGSGLEPPQDSPRLACSTYRCRSRRLADAERSGTSGEVPVRC